MNKINKQKKIHKHCPKVKEWDYQNSNFVNLKRNFKQTKKKKPNNNNSNNKKKRIQNKKKNLKKLKARKSKNKFQKNI